MEMFWEKNLQRQLPEAETFNQQVDFLVSYATLLIIYLTLQRKFRIQPIPVRRVKKIIRLDENVINIASDVPYVMSKATEYFITRLTQAAWDKTKQDKRLVIRPDFAISICRFYTLLGNKPEHLREAASQDDQYDFLVDIFHEALGPANDRSFQ
eukprot:gene1561-4709_t